MKRLGLLGGMSWQSSIEYERIINELVQERVGGVASADLLIRSFNFADIEALQQAGRWDDAGQLLAQAASNLADGGADAIVICTNTMHRLAATVQAAVCPSSTSPTPLRLRSSDRGSTSWPCSARGTRWSRTSTWERFATYTV